MILSGKTPLLALCIALSAAVSWAFDGRTIDRNPDQCDVDIIDTVSWYSTESLRLTINPWRCGERVEIPSGATALWIVQDESGTNWIVRCATTVTPSNAVFTLEAGQGALPPGHDYTGFVDLMQGTTILGVLDRFEVRVLPTSSDTNSIVPAAGTWESLYGAIASNTAAIDAMQTNWPAGGSYVVKTNGAWVIVQDPNRTALEYAGQTLLEAIADHEIDQPIITGLLVEESGLVLTFLGAPTNRLEYTSDHANWQTWDSCTWSYNGLTGTVVVSEIPEENWYRIVAVGTTPDRASAHLLAPSPIYLGQYDADHQVATLGAVRDGDTFLRTEMGRLLPREGWVDLENPSPTNLAWKIGRDGAIFNALTLGGTNGTALSKWPSVNSMTGAVTLAEGENVSIAEDPETQTITISASGGGSGSGFPLTEDADFAGYAAEDVGSLQLSGSTNLLTYGDGKLLYGGEPIETGPPNLEAGHAIVLTENTNTDAVVIAVSDNPTFNNMTLRGDLTVVGVEYQNTTIYHTTNVYLGTITNHLYEDRYITNYSWEVHSVVARTTNYVDEVVNVGGDVDHSRAASVKEPSFTIDNTDTNAPVLTATGAWNLSGATLDFGNNLDAYATRSWTTTQVGTRLPSTANITVNGTNYALASNPTITIDPGGGGTVTNAWGVFYDDAGTGKTATGESAIQFLSTTNHPGIIWGPPKTIDGRTVQVLEIGTGDSSSGSWTPSSRIVDAPSSTVLPSDYLIWLDTTATTNIVLTLPDMAEPSQTIVVRRLGDTGTATLSRGTNSFPLLYNGDGCTVDWLAAKTNWYWRTF